MLERPWQAAVQPNWREQDAPQDFINLADITSFVRRYVFLLIAFPLVGLVCAAFYIATSDPTFTARTQILIEPKIPQILQQQASDVNLSLDTAQVESQLAVLRSRKIATMVIDQLQLVNNPAFRDLRGPTFGERLHRMWRLVVPQDASGNGGLETVTGFLSSQVNALALSKSDNGSAKIDRMRLAVELFADGLDVQRVGVSYAVDIRFDAIDPDLAADIANATADAFVREQVETRAAAASQGVSWLEMRIREIRDQMNEATQIAQEFRAKHDYSVDRQLPADVPFDGLAKIDSATPPAPTLEQLEVTAQTYRKMYESLLSAYANSVDQQPFLIANARVITSATSPQIESNPRKKLVLAFGLLAGLVAGIGVAFARQNLDRTLRSPRQIRDELGLACLGELPPVKFKRGGFGRLDEVVRRPQSPFSANLKGAKAAIGSLGDVTQHKRHIGITSVSPGDGKSTVVSNLAALFAASGMRTLVINADPDSALTSELVRPARSTEIATGQDDAEQAAWQITFVEPTSFYYLQNVAVNGQNLLVPKNMQALLKQLEWYEVVIVELPPFTSGADGLAIGPLLDGVIIVAEWGETPLDPLADLTQTLRAAKSAVVGVLMTRVRSLSTRGHRKRAAQPPR